MTAEPSCKDEARVGQQGTLTYVWAERGSRPQAPKDLRYKWAYLFGVVCAECGVGAAPVLPYANTDAMNLHLAEVSRSVAAGAHAVLVCDSAGWHKTRGRLRVPGNVSLLHLPPYIPELNPVENVWDYLRNNKPSDSVFDTYDMIVDRCCAAWNWFIETQTASNPSQPRVEPKQSKHRTVSIIPLATCHPRRRLGDPGPAPPYRAPLSQTACHRRR